MLSVTLANTCYSVAIAARMYQCDPLHVLVAFADYVDDVDDDELYADEDDYDDEDADDEGCGDDYSDE